MEETFVTRQLKRKREEEEQEREIGNTGPGVQQQIRDKRARDITESLKEARDF